MRSDRIALHAAGLALATLSAAAAHADNSPFGVWIDHTGRGAVEITECGGKLCGRVAWVKDAENGSECGKQIIGNVEPVGTNKWDNGWIYDPDRGKKFDVEVTALDGDKLRVKGYAGTKWLSETYTWKRAPADLQKCSAGEAAEATTPAANKAAETAKSTTDDEEPVELNAAKSDTGGSKADTGKVAKSDQVAPQDDDKKRDTAKADPQEDEGDGPPAAGKGDGKKVVARIMEQLESGDGPVKLKRTGKTCKLNVPYVDMVVSFRCDKDE